MIVSLTIDYLAAATVNINVTGTVTLAPNATLDVDRLDPDQAFFPTPPATFPPNTPLVIANDGGDAVNGTFAGLPEGTEFQAANGQTLRISYQANAPDGMNDIVAAPVPVAPEDPDDLIGFASDGGWYVGASDGSSFATSLWAGWSAVAWDFLEQGDFNDDGRTDVLGLIDGSFYVGLSTGSSFATSLWTQWANVDWRDLLIGDLNDDGRDDILARVGGQWWGALSNGFGFNPPTIRAQWENIDWDYFALGTRSGRPALFGLVDGQWFIGTAEPGSQQFAGASYTVWPNAAWDAIHTLDINGDGHTDLAGLVDGNWYISTQAGDASVWISWGDFAWRDPVVGDFNGDGRDDLAARLGGTWWVATFDENGGSASSTRWETWSDVDWKDVTVGDFDGDGRDDLAGRYLGEWWVGVSTGGAFHTTLWDTWTEGIWQTVFAGDVTGPEGIGGGSTGGAGSMSTSGGGLIVWEPYLPYLNDAHRYLLGGLITMAYVQSEEDALAMLWESEEDELLDALVTAA